MRTVCGPRSETGSLQKGLCCALVLKAYKNPHFHRSGVDLAQLTVPGHTGRWDSRGPGAMSALKLCKHQDKQTEHQSHDSACCTEIVHFKTHKQKIPTNELSEIFLYYQLHAPGYRRPESKWLEGIKQCSWSKSNPIIFQLVEQKQNSI